MLNRSMIAASGFAFLLRLRVLARLNSDATTVRIAQIRCVPQENACEMTQYQTHIEIRTAYPTRDGFKLTSSYEPHTHQSTTLHLDTT